MDNIESYFWNYSQRTFWDFRLLLLKKDFHTSWATLSNMLFASSLKTPNWSNCSISDSFGKIPAVWRKRWSQYILKTKTKWEFGWSHSIIRCLYLTKSRLPRISEVLWLFTWTKSKGSQWTKVCFFRPRSCQSKGSGGHGWPRSGRIACSVCSAEAVQCGRWCSICIRWRGPRLHFLHHHRYLQVQWRYLFLLICQFPVRDYQLGHQIHMIHQ